MTGDGRMREELRRVSPDREMAKSILKMVAVRLKELETKEREEFATLVVEDYYEILKELVTAIMAVDGYKTLSHEALFKYVKSTIAGVSESEVLFMNQLRVIRNKIAYKGFFINVDFLERNESRIRVIVEKLRSILIERLNRSGAGEI